MSDIEKIYPLLIQYGIKKAALFGARVQNEAADNSDLDIVVSFERPYDLLDIVGLKQDMEDTLSAAVNLITYESLTDDVFSESVLTSEKVIYERDK